MKNVRKILATVLVAIMMLAMTACGEMLENLTTTTTEHLETLMKAYTSGDVETFQKGLEEDNKLNYLMNAIGDSDSSGMKGVYQKVYELTKEAEITVVGPIEDNTINDEYIKIQIKTVDFTAALKEAMEAAAAESGEAFADMPGWMMEALNTGGVPVEMELDVRISTNGVIMGQSQDIYNVLTGGFYDYITYTMTSCEFDDGKSFMIADYDHIIYSLDEYVESMEGYELSQEDIDSYVAMYAREYEGHDGVFAGGNCIDDNLRLYQFVNYEVASSFSLQKLGIVSGGYADYISLDATIDGYEAEGVTCETTDFGSGVLAE